MTKSLNTYVLRIDEPKSQSLLFKAADDDAEKHAVMLLVALGAHPTHP